MCMPNPTSRQIDLIPADDRPIATDILKFDKTFRIAVTGDVFLLKEERLIVDTPHFQRLRGVRQLGTVNAIYPTALHTRFDHSLGTLAMADRMVMAIAQNPGSVDNEKAITKSQRLLARLYALLHDITHIPFGHTIEDELGLYERHDKNPTRINHFLGPESPIGKIIVSTYEEQGGHQGFYDRFMSIFLWHPDYRERQQRRTSRKWSSLKKHLHMNDDDLFIHDIVSNTVCADLLDYIRRDSYFCNLQIDLEYRFLHYLYLKCPEESSVSGDSDETHGKRRVFIRLWKRGKNIPRRDILTDLTRLLEARYMIAERAYFHHAKLVTSAMIGRAIQESTLYTSPGLGNREDHRLYDHSDDTLLMEVVRSEKDVSSKRSNLPMLGSRLRNRNLHKIIYKFEQKAFDEVQEKDHKRQFRNEAMEMLADPRSRRDIENMMAAEIGAPPGSVLIYAPPTEDEYENRKSQCTLEGKGPDSE